MTSTEPTRPRQRRSDPFDHRWDAVRRRDPTADGSFVYAVETTGVFCRPSCPARRPKRENVCFFSDAASAAHGGYRPCKRCRPDRPEAASDPARVAGLCRYIESRTQPPTLAELARFANMSPFHLHRLFKREVGVTPRGYAEAIRAERLRAALPTSRSVTEAIYEAGYSSSARFYASSARLLGMRPSDYRSGAKRRTLRFAVADCSLGHILVAASDRGVCAVLLGDEPQKLVLDLERRFPGATLACGDTQFGTLVARVIALVEEPSRKRPLPLDIRGTAFQQRVWQALSKVPPGSTVSYTALARAIGAPDAARAVARACAANPLAVAIPCHRVVRSDGGLSGYRWGIERKRALLEREARPEARRNGPARSKRAVARRP